MLNGIKLDEVYDVVITALENEGAGVAKINGVIIFVPKALVGEKVRIRITEIKKNFARGKVVQILEKSEERIESICPYYNECGGCNLRHQNSSENLKFKKSKVINALERIGKLKVKVEDVISSTIENNYRNKASFKVEDDRIGFYGEGTYQLVDIENCLLLRPEINNVLKYIRKYIKEHTNNINSIVVKYGNALGEILIEILSKDDSDINIIDYLLVNVSNIKSIIYNDKVVYGNGYIKQVSNGLMFNCSLRSFFQVNVSQTEKLYKIAIEEAKLSKEDVVLDLYCGTGTITSIVSCMVKKVIGIEIVEDAVIDAIENAKINNISNVKFICGDAAKEISKLKEKFDVIIIDPPRKGIDRKAIAIIKKIMPKKIVYISCNPVTMARDLNLLSDLYDIQKVVPVDMFPNTSHIECICILKLKK